MTHPIRPGPSFKLTTVPVPVTPKNFGKRSSTVTTNTQFLPSRPNRPSIVSEIDPLAFLPTQSTIVAPKPKTLPLPVPVPLLLPVPVPVPRPPVKLPPKLDSSYLIRIDKATGLIQFNLQKNSKQFTNETSSIIVKALRDEKLLLGMGATRIRCTRLDQSEYEKEAESGGVGVVLRKKGIDPGDLGKVVTFIIKGLKLTNKTPVVVKVKVKPPAPAPAVVNTNVKAKAPVEVIDLDSDSDDEDNVATKPNPKPVAVAVAVQPQPQVKVQTQTQPRIPAQRGRPRKNPSVIPQLVKPLKPPPATTPKPQQQQQPKPQPPPLKLLKDPPPRSPSPLKENTLVTKSLQPSPFRLPTKCIIPAGKSLATLYRIKDLIKFTDLSTESGAELSYAEHDFVDGFVVVGISGLKKKIKAKAREKEKIPPKAKEKEKEVAVVKKKNTTNERNEPETRSLRNRKRPATDSRAETPPPPPKKQMLTRSNRIVKELNLSPSSSSSSSSSSGSSSGSGSGSSSEDEDESEDENEGTDSRLRPRTTTTKKPIPVKEKAKPKPKDAYKPPPKYLGLTPPCHPLRRSPTGHLYFSLTSKQPSREQYRNIDLLTNWEKGVRNESEVGNYFRTSLVKGKNTSLIFYHVEKRGEKILLDRVVELSSEGLIKISLNSTDVTETFLCRINIETNNHLNSLLLNLINSTLCPGCPAGYNNKLSFFPGSVLIDDVFYSKNCSKVVFNDAENFVENVNSNFSYSYPRCCESCIDLRSKLEKENVTKKVKTLKKFNYGKYKPPATHETQGVRKGLDELFLGFWKEMGFAQEVFPEGKSKVEVDVVKEEDFAKAMKEQRDLENQLPVPIITNIRLEENGRTHLEFSEMNLNLTQDQLDNDSINSDLSSMIETLMSSEDPDVVFNSINSMGDKGNLPVPVSTPVTAPAPPENSHLLVPVPVPSAQHHQHQVQVVQTQDNHVNQAQHQHQHQHQQSQSHTQHYDNYYDGTIETELNFDQVQVQLSDSLPLIFPGFGLTDL